MDVSLWMVTLPVSLVALGLSVARQIALAKNDAESTASTRANVETDEQRAHRHHSHRINKLIENRKFISPSGFYARKQYYVENANLLKTPKPNENQSPAELGDVISKLLKSQAGGTLPILLVGSLITKLFGSNPAAIVPFPLPTSVVAFFQNTMTRS